jgi:hypothetical protein
VTSEISLSYPKIRALKLLQDDSKELVLNRWGRWQAVALGKQIDENLSCSEIWCSVVNWSTVKSLQVQGLIVQVESNRFRLTEKGMELQI